MPWYRCFVRGENFPGELIGLMQPVGFYVGHFVQADDEETAEAICLEELRHSPTLVLPPDTVRREDARVYFETIEDWPADRVPKAQPGITFYRMEGSEEGHR